MAPVPTAVEWKGERKGWRLTRGKSEECQGRKIGKE